jgi:hypothetical protein
MLSSRKGAQEPRIRVLPPLDDYDNLYSDGEAACELAASFNVNLFPWQQNVIHDWLKRTDDDKFAASRCGLSVPRQNGKNEVISVRELYGLCVIGEKILHTAHRVDTAYDAFLRLVAFFENPDYPELQEMVVQIRRTNGQEGITLTNGARIKFSSRVNGSGRGSTYDMIVFDEAQELTKTQLEGIMSAMAAAPLGNRQMFFTGTPPSPESPGDVFKKVRNTSIDGSNKHSCWYEWSVENIGDVTDRDRWYATNPSLGLLITEDFVEDEMSTMDADGFARERLDWWTTEKSANAVFKLADWNKITCQPSEAPAPTTDEKIAFGVKFSPDGASYALSAAVKRPEGPVFFECIQSGLCINGVGSIAKWLVERKNKCSMCAIDGRMNTTTLAQKLIEGGFPKKGIKILNTKEISAASEMFCDAVSEEAVLHASSPTLDESALSAIKRPIGKDGAWGFGDGNVSCTPLESVAIAYWAVMTTKRRAGRKSKLL